MIKTIRPLYLCLVLNALLGGAPLPSLALSLGEEARILTSLGQPLRAEIALPAATPAELKSLTLRLAPSREYVNAGLEYLSLLDQLQFQIERRNDGGALIAIMTKSPIYDPAIPLILDVQWAGGHILREYVLALDPPKLQVVDGPPANPAKPAPNVAMGTEKRSTHSENVTRTNDVPQGPITTRTPHNEPSSRPSAEGKDPPSRDHYGPIEGDETLSEIAMRVRPDPKLSLPQVILGLYDANPDAFVDGDINRLREGETLRLPDIASYRATKRGDALRELENLTAAKGASGRGASRFKVELAAPRVSPTLDPATHGALPDATPHETGVSPADILTRAPVNKDMLQQQIATTNSIIELLRQQNQDLEKKITEMQQQSQSLLRQLEARGIIIPSAPVVASSAVTPPPPAPVTAENTPTEGANPSPIPGATRVLTAHTVDDGPDGTLIILLAVVVTLAAGLAQVLTDVNRQKILEWIRSIINKRGGTSL